MPVGSATLARGALSALPSQLALLDDAGEIVYTNDEWASFAAENDYDGDPEMVGTNYLAVCERSADEDAAAAAAGIRDVMANETERFAYEYPCHGPEERRWFLMRAIEYDVDAATYVLVMHLDITERKRAELEVADRSERLETVARILSHDLKNPLGVAMGRTELLAAQAADEVQEHVDGVDGALAHMDDILTDALLFARDDFEPETEAVSLASAARDAWSGVDSGLSLTVADGGAGATIAANRPLLRHVLENLLRNAADHGGTAVRVGTTGAGFYVADDGPGVPPDVREDVFRPDFSTSAGGASGLGLTIVREAAAVHGWEVSVTNAASGGARFEVAGVESPDCGGPSR